MAVMGQVLRITYNNSDYSFQLLNQRPVSKETEEIQILLNGTTQTLVCRNGRWLPGEQADMPDRGLVDAIGKAIALRFRI